MKRTLITLLTIITMVSCANNKRQADISNIDINIKINRFDQVFWNLDTLNIIPSAQTLIQQYPDMSKIYLENVIQFGNPDSSITWDTYRLFRKDTAVSRIYTDALNQYTNVKDIEEQLSLAFRRAKYFFPEIPTPSIYMHVSGFNQSVVIGSNFLSMSIDNYLGENYPIYEQVGIYNYQRANMTRKKVVSDYLTAWVASEFYLNKVERNLLDEIIYRGKIMYMVATLLPNEKEEVIMGYTSEQWQWSLKHEDLMWGTLVANKDIFSQDMVKNGGYINDGPFTVHFSQDSPARGGIFVGWRIVEAYMKNNKNISPLELMQNSNANDILQHSGYNPK